MGGTVSKETPKAYFLTMGCAKNEVDTRDMKSRLQSVGVSVTDSLDDCDVAIVNTCSFIQSAVEESIDAILDIANCDEILERHVPVIVAGCMPSRYGDELQRELSEVKTFIPCSKEDDVARIVLDCLGEKTGIANIDGVRPETLDENGQKSLSAYVKISDGCDRFCSYCTIPMIRGRYHSFPYEEISSDVCALQDAGVKEIVLIGQDTGLWGSDLGEGLDLSVLMDRLATEFPELLFRAMYTQPENVTESLLDVIARHSNIATYLDIPFQHCSPEILESMNRKGSSEEFLELIEKARSKVPGIAIRTTLMVGFPGEGDQEFEELVEFVEDAELEYVGIFAYSQEDGTKAAKMADQVQQTEKDERYSTLRDLADSVSNSVISKRIGSDARILVEGIEEDGQLFGRSTIQAPEVDGVTFMDEGNVGEFVEGRIDDTLFYDMEASKL